MTEEEMFKQSAAKMKQEIAETKQQEEQSESKSPEFESIKWLSLEDGKDIAFRIVGKPYDFRTEPWDTKLVFWSDILDDNQVSMRRILWKPQLDSNGRAKNQIDKTWILFKLYDAITKKVWDNSTNTYEYVHQGHPLLERVLSNKRPNQKYGQSFYPRTRTLMNVIDRQDDWCKNNKHTKVLTSRCNIVQRQDKEYVFADIGVPHGNRNSDGVYQAIIVGVVDFQGHWNLDVIARKSKAKKDYDVRDVTDKKIIDPAASLLAKGLIHDKPLTEVEQAYEKYNFDKLFEVTAYSKLDKVAKNLFKAWDAYESTRFYEELQDLKSIEQKEQESNEKSANRTVSTPNETQPELTNTETPQPTERQGQAATPTQTVDTSELEKLCSEKFACWEKTPKSDKEQILNGLESFDGETPVWKKDINVLACGGVDCKHPNDTLDLPTKAHHCPKCGIDLE